MTAVTTPDGALALVFAAADERRDVEAPLLVLARQTGWLAYHTHSSRRSAPGFPDIVCIRLPTQPTTRYGPPYVLFCECKRQGGKLTVAQRVWGQALSCIELASGGAIIYRVVRPSNRAEVEAILVGAQPGAGKPHPACRLERELVGR